MNITNYEFKARTNRLEELEEKLQGLNPEFKGEDHQIDTYFKIDKGRLKLREGNIENSLIYYQRENTASAKTSEISLYRHEKDQALKDILIKALGERIVVDKMRRIYFIGNVKFHFDKVQNLGTFVEVEAIDESGNIGIEKLRDQCDYYSRFLEVDEDDYIAESYSDMIDKYRK